MELIENLISTTSMMAYCCNQATENKKNQLTENYATKKFNYNSNEKFEELLLEFLVNDKDKCTKALSQLVSCFNYYEKCKSDEMDQQQFDDTERPKVVYIGNKPTRMIEKIDFSTMPEVHVVKLPKESTKCKEQAVCSKRKCDSDDETDSCFDYKIIEHKRLKSDHSDISKLSKIQPNKNQGQDASFASFECLSETSLWNLANKYNDLKEYRDISVGLGLDENEISIVESKYLARDGLKECFYQCLLTWRLQEPENCTLNYFLQVLERKVNKSNEFIEQLKHRLEFTDIEKNQNTLNLYLNKFLLNAEEINIKLEESHLWEASGIMAQQWKTIGRSFGLSEIDLYSIEAKCLFTEGIRECCYQMLLQWSQCFYEQSNFENLCLGLIGMKLNLLAKKFIELIFVK